MHQTIDAVTSRIDRFEFNTAISALMELSNVLGEARGAQLRDAYETLLKLLHPFAPHITEELWSRRLAAAGQPWSSIHMESWPTVDEAAAAVSVREVPIQVNGKLRDKVIVAADADQATIEREALAAPKIAAILDGRQPDRIIHAGGKLVNIVLRDA